MNNLEQAACHPSKTGRTKLKKTILWSTFAGWAITLFILSSMPGNCFGPPPFSWADKVVHATIFTIGAGLFASAFYQSFGWSTWKAAALVFLTMVLIGVSDEFHQTFTPGRSGNDRGDLAADAAGTLFGIVLAGLFHGKRPTKPHFPAPGPDRAA